MIYKIPTCIEIYMNRGNKVCLNYIHNIFHSVLSMNTNPPKKNLLVMYVLIYIKTTRLLALRLRLDRVA